MPASTAPAARSVVVSGAAGGLGKAIVRHLIWSDCSVAALDRDFSGWDLAPNERLSVYEVDLTDSDSLFGTIAAAVGVLGGCDGVVANAAIVDTLRRAETFPADKWDRDIAVNLTGAFRLVQSLFEPLSASGDGRVVFVSSIAGDVGQPAQAAYAASKAGIVGLARTLAVEWADKGITCNVVMPGMIDTPKVRSLPPALREKLLSRIPAGRFATTEEVAGSVAFLLSDAAAAITGSVLRVDGGYVLNNIALSTGRTDTRSH